MLWLTTTLRLANDPRPIATKTGTPMATGFGFADIEGAEGFGLGVVAFGNIAEELIRYRKGDSIRACGSMRENRYTGRDGVEKVTLQVTLDGLAGVKRSTPVQRESKPQARQRAAGQAQAHDPAPFEDELDF